MVEKRNIVLITLDSIRADHCSFMGYHRETTPTFDKIARKGLYFENAIASGVPTAPSLVGVFTGDYSSNDLRDWKPNRWRAEIRQRRTFPEILLEHGYYTAAFNPNPGGGKYFGFDKGFKFFEDFMKDYFVKKPNLIAKIRKVINKEHALLYWEKFYISILEWYEKIGVRSQPFFLWILLLDTHVPYLPPKKTWSRNTLIDDLILLYTYYKIDRRNCKAGSKSEIRRIVNAYDDAIRYSDSFVERLVKDLNDSDPVIIIHGDHGDYLGDHGYYFHPPRPNAEIPPLYEGLIHVPLIIFNVDQKGCVDNPVSLLRLAPTILELAGIKNESSKSLFNVESEWAIVKVIDGGKLKIAVRTKDWKYIKGQVNGDELYNIRKDPMEQANLIDDHSDIAKEMRKIVERYVGQEKEKKQIRESILKIKNI